jgi:glycosyltransferase involved in cell wall biosynthesis
LLCCAPLAEGGSVSFKALLKSKVKGLLNAPCVPPADSDYELVRQSCLFDAKFYLAANPGAFADPVQHFLDFAVRTKSSPSLFFNTEYYLETYKDIQSSGVNPLVHYLRHGVLEGRSPNILFDPKFYMSQVGGLLSSPLEHLVKHPNQYEFSPFLSLAKLSEIFSDKRTSYLAQLSDPSNSGFRQIYVKDLVDRLALKTQRTTVDEVVQSFEIIKLGVPNLHGVVDVVIPLKNAFNWLVLCLQQLKKISDAAIIREVIVVDDGSEQEVLDKVHPLFATFANLSFLRNLLKPGFGVTCNAGFKHSSAEYILFLNSDCLLADATISNLLAVAKSDPKIGLVSALANKASNLSLHMPDGRYYSEVASQLERVAQERNVLSYNACTVVGHCMLATRSCYEALSGFDPVWDKGYGEESDLHFRAIAKGFLAKVATNTFVYHYGGGSFSSEEGTRFLKKKNFRLFLNYWGEAYDTAIRLHWYDDQRRVLARHLAKCRGSNQNYEMLFILPGLQGGVGGIQVVIDLCNHLFLRGHRVMAAVVGPIDEEVFRTYHEMLLFSPLAFTSFEGLKAQAISTPIVFGTLFSTAKGSAKYAESIGAKFYNFVQGYEPYFNSGMSYTRAVESYALPKRNYVISEWLKSKVQSHGSVSPVKLLRSGVDLDFFYPTIEEPSSEGPIRVGFVLRAIRSKDKGQYILREIIHRLSQDARFKAVVFAPAEFRRDFWRHKHIEVHYMPVNRGKIATVFRTLHVFVDGSQHEGFGLMPLEAMACGVPVVVANSGGVTDYLRHGENGFLVDVVNNPDIYQQYIERLVENPSTYTQMRRQAIATAANYNFLDTVNFFEDLMKEDACDPSFQPQAVRA